MFIRKISGIKVFWFLLVLTISSNSFATKEKKIPQSKEDIKLILDVYSKIQKFEKAEEIDSMNFYVAYGHSLCEQLDLGAIDSKKTELIIAEIYCFFGDVNYYDNKRVEPVTAYEKAVRIFKKHNIKSKYADGIYNLSTMYAKIGEEPKSLELMHEATSIFIDLKDTTSIIDGYRCIGILYKRQKDYPRSHEYLNKALKLSKNTDNVNSSINLVVALALMNKTEGKLEKAKELYHEALKLSKLTKDELLRSNVYSNLGEFYKDIGDLDKAIIYFDKANVIIEESDSDYKRSFMWLNYSDYYFLRENYQQAVFYGEKALRLSEEINNKRAEYVTLNILLKIYDKLNDPDQEAIYQKRVIEHLNEHKDDLNEQINGLETVRYKLDKQKMIAKNEQIRIQLDQEQKNQKRRYIYILVICLFIILLTFSLIIFFKLKSTKEYNKNITKQSEERKLLLQEVHHRVKNNFQIVSSILRLQSYGFKNEGLRVSFNEAVNRINAMAIVHNVIYRQEKFKDIDAKNYLERLVENLRKTGDSRIQISIDSEEIPFKIETLINLGIALNELITNSFKHAFISTFNIDPKIAISLHKLEDESFELKYKDNGIGFSVENYKASFGMELIDTIISNYEGKVVYRSEEEWNNVVLITFKEE